MSAVFRNVFPDSRKSWSTRASSRVVEDVEELGDKLSSEKFFSKSDHLFPRVIKFFTKKQIKVSGLTHCQDG